MKNVVTILVIVVATFVAIPAFAQEAPPAQFTMSFQWRHPCTKEGFSILRNLDEVPDYVAREDTGTWHVRAGFSTDSESSCDEAAQRQYVEQGRLPKAIEVLQEHGWPMGDPTIVRVTRAAIPGEAQVMVTWVPAAPLAPKALTPPPAPVLTTEEGQNDAGLPGTWFFINGERNAFVPNGQKGDAGAAGAKGDGEVGAGAFEVLTFGVRGILGNFGRPIGKRFKLAGGDYQSLEHGESVLFTVGFRLHGGRGVRFGVTGELGFTFNQIDENNQIDRERRFSAGGTFDMLASRDSDLFRFLWGAGSRTHGIYAFDGEYYYHRKQAVFGYMGLGVVLNEKEAKVRPTISLRGELGWGNDKLPLTWAGILSFELEISPRNNGG